MTTLTIPARFNGPPGSANGGVTCGMLSEATGLNEITLRQPPPVDVELRVEEGSLYDDDTLVASAAAGTTRAAASAQADRIRRISSSVSPETVTLT